MEQEIKTGTVLPEKFSALINWELKEVEFLSFEEKESLAKVKLHDVQVQHMAIEHIGDQKVQVSIHTREESPSSKFSVITERLERDHTGSATVAMSAWIQPDRICSIHYEKALFSGKHSAALASTDALVNRDMFRKQMLKNHPLYIRHFQRGAKAGNIIRLVRTGKEVFVDILHDRADMDVVPAKGISVTDSRNAVTFESKTLYFEEWMQEHVWKGGHEVFGDFVVTARQDLHACAIVSIPDEGSIFVGYGDGIMLLKTSESVCKNLSSMSDIIEEYLKYRNVENTPPMIKLANACDYAYDAVFLTEKLVRPVGQM